MKTVPSYWIDAHAHLDLSAAAGGLSGADLLISGMYRAGIGKTILWSLRGGFSISSDVIAAYHKYPDRIILFRGDDGLNLNDPSTLNIIRADLDMGIFRGLGEIASHHAWISKDVPEIDIPPDHPVMIGLFKLAHEYGIPVTIHMGAPTGVLPRDIPPEFWLSLRELLTSAHQQHSSGHIQARHVSMFFKGCLTGMPTCMQT